MNTVFGQTLYDTIAPVAEADPDRVAMAICDTVGAMFQRLDEFAADTDAGPGLSMLLDPDRVPADWLDWEASLYGVTLVAGSTEAAQRARIRDLPPQHRGTVAYMVTAIQQVLAGSKSVRVLEKTGPAVLIDFSWDSLSGTWDTFGTDTWSGILPFSTTAYSVTVIVRATETSDTAAATAQAVATKPGGLGLTFVVQAEFPWDGATHTWAAVSGTTTWDDTGTVSV